MLCKLCSDLDFDKATSEEGAPHHRTYADLLNAAINGCELCAEIDEQKMADEIIEEEEEEEEEKEDRITCYFNDVGEYVCWRKGGREDPFASLYVFTTDDDNMAGLVWARKTHEDVTSEEFFELIDSWMDECKGDHPECMQRNDMVLPSRVIDVGSEGNDPYLFIAGGQTGRWITLSYCWGGKPPLRTELWNLRQRCERIPFDELPVLFRDAVIITRRLGYKYLWIDALCIIQDSPKDWTIESANMGYIYKESSMTIIAEASEDCEVGIFESTGVDREAILFKISSHSTASNTRGTLYLGQNMVDGQISRGPVSLRAWTLQEAILSRRVLRFARGQVWWQCHRAQWNERDPCGIASTALTKWKSSMSPRLTLERGNEQFDTPWCKPLRCWYRIVNDYSARRLTYQKDRFPAIAGIAKEVQRHIPRNIRQACGWMTCT